MSVGSPIKRQSLQKMVYERLRHAILAREIEPGEQLKIGELAASFKVSAIPVREALRQLEAESMITFGPQKRIVVNQLSLEDLHDIYSMLYPLEEMAVKKCFEHLNSRSIDELEKTFLKTTVQELSTSEWLNLNWDFHNKIYELAGSPRLTQVVGSLRTGIRPYLCLSFKDSRRISQANKEHASILKAFKTVDWKTCKKAVRQHLKNGCDAIDALLRQESQSAPDR